MQAAWTTLVILLLAPAATATAQEGRLWHGPYRGDMLRVTAVRPDGGMPLDISKGALAVAPLTGAVSLTADVRVMGIRSFTLDDVVLLAAIGPTAEGMSTVHLVLAADAVRPPGGQPPRSRAVTVRFEARAHESLPVLAALDRETRAVVTVQKIFESSGRVLWENPDAAELLWRALGRPPTSPDS